MLQGKSNDLTAEQVKDFDNRWHKFLKDKTNIFTWDEVRAEALKKLKQLRKNKGEKENNTNPIT